MTLDEAIKHCREAAEEYDLAAGTYRILAENSHNVFENMTAEAHSSRCVKCATDHKQLAEWLDELKQRREWCSQYEVEQISNLERYDMLSRECEILNERYKETVRLLKVAVDDMARTESCFLCKYYDKPDESCQTTDDCFVWRYADEVRKLLKNVEE